MSAPQRGGRGERSSRGEREVRWSARRKARIVLRVLKGEDISAVAEVEGIARGELESWVTTFVESGTEGLKTKTRLPETRLLEEAERKIGELAVEVEMWREAARRGPMESFGREILARDAPHLRDRLALSEGLEEHRGR